MSEKSFRKALSGLSLGDLRYYAQVRSSNDTALVWAAEGAPDLSLVYADEQTGGRGRMGRRWFTPPGSALAFSLIFRPNAREREHIGLFSGLGALALLEVLKVHGVAAQVKWPNDVLIGGNKTAGILVETVWTGADVDSLVLGMGINVFSESIPPSEELNFPATCIQTELGGGHLDRFALLHSLLDRLIKWRPRLTSELFMRTWDESLAYRGQDVRVTLGGEEITGRIVGLEGDGRLLLDLGKGDLKGVSAGEVHLRPL